MHEPSDLAPFLRMLQQLREPLLIASRSGRILSANVAAAEALGTSVATLEGSSVASFSVDPAGIEERLHRGVTDAPFAVRARDGRRFTCDASLLTPELLLLRLSGGPEADARDRVFLETLSRLRRARGFASSRESPEEVANSLVTRGMQAVGSPAMGIYVLDETGTNLELAAQGGYTDANSDRYRLVPLNAPIPLTEAVRHGAPVVLETAEDFRARFPAFAQARPQIAENAIACIPLEREGRVVGVLGLGFLRPWSYTDENREALRALAQHCVEALAEVGRFDADPASHRLGTRSASPLERLHAFTRTLAQAIAPAHVAEAVVDMGMAAASARAAGLWLLNDDGTVSLTRGVGPLGPVAEDFVRVSLEQVPRLAILDAIRTGIPVWLESSRQVEERYPDAFKAFFMGAESSLACVPLLAQGRCIGGLALNFEGVRRFHEDERSFLQLLAWHAAHAIERSRLYAAEQRAREAAEANQCRSEFLADAGSLLASSLDYASTLADVAYAAVPRVADWCIVELEEERLQGAPPVAAHVDPSKVSFVLELSRRFRARANARHGIPGVIESGASVLYRVVTVEDIRRAFPDDPELAALYESTGITSSMIVPISARGRTLGAILLNSASRSRHYDEEDLAMAQELGRRAGLAVDNARLYRDAREADRLKDEFLAMLGHELRNPLAPIVTALDLMNFQGGSAFTRERAIIARNVRQVVRLVDDLLDVARITRGKIQLDREVCEVATILAKAAEMASPLVTDRAQHLTLSVPANDLRVMVDPARLAQAVANLLDNAAKYTERGGRISVVAQASGSEATIRVRDSGIGIEREMLPRIFDLFVQEKGALDRARGGLGIGLTVVKSLVALHGGAVSADSAGLGHGSEFTIRLPLAPRGAVSAPNSDARASAPSDAPAPSGGLRVLVVDDNADSAALLGDTLAALGCSARIAHDGASALAAAVDLRPDLALLDVGLPIMSGYELAQRLRQTTGGSTMKIVAVTGYAQVPDHQRSRQAGFDDHFTKPVSIESLRQILDRCRDETLPT
jgi:signal transduction histidine kinase